MILGHANLASQRPAPTLSPACTELDGQDLASTGPQADPYQPLSVMQQDIHVKPDQQPSRPEPQLSLPPCRSSSSPDRHLTNKPLVGQISMHVEVKAERRKKAQKEKKDSRAVT